MKLRQAHTQVRANGVQAALEHLDAGGQLIIPEGIESRTLSKKDVVWIKRPDRHHFDIKLRGKRDIRRIQIGCIWYAAPEN